MVSTLPAGPCRVVTTGPFCVPGIDGAMMAVPVGTVINRVIHDPDSPWTPPDGTMLCPDAGVAWRDPAQVAAPPAPVDAHAWLQRLPEAVRTSLARALQSEPNLQMDLTLIAARGTLDLTDPHGMLRGFLDLAVKVTAEMDHPLTPAIAEAMLRP